MTTKAQPATPPVEHVPEDAMTVTELLAVLRRREAIQRALAECSQCLMGSAESPADERQALVAALERLRVGARMLRVALFVNFVHPEAGFSSRPFVETYAPGECGLDELFGPDYSLPWTLEEHRRALAAGEHVGGPVERLFSQWPEIIAIERRLGIGAVQFFSIFLDGQWWGYLVFDDREAHDWDAPQVLMIRTAAELIGSFLQRNRAMTALREREAMLRALGDNLPDAYIYQLEDYPDGTFRRTYLSRGLDRRATARR